MYLFVWEMGVELVHQAVECKACLLNLTPAASSAVGLDEILDSVYFVHVSKYETRNSIAPRIIAVVC